MLETTPRQEVLWRPNPGPQTQFLATRANDVCYGGAAGGGKSAGLFAQPLRWIDNPRYRCLYLRREAKYLGEAIDKTNALYPLLGARLVLSPRIIWTFPSGAQIWMNHCEHEKDVRNYDSFEFSQTLFDELTHFTEKQVRGIRARLRGVDPSLPYNSRAATNPGGEGHEWVFARYAAWLDPRHPNPAKPGEVRWYLGDEEVERGRPNALSRTFIPALLKDNPYVAKEYDAQLEDLDPVRKAQLRYGDWLTKPAPKAYWDRAKITHVDRPPTTRIARVRCWDFGATATGDWTVGAKASIDSSKVVTLEHVTRFRGPPSEVRSRFSAIAKSDAESDPECVQWIPQDPGQAGLDQVQSYQAENPGIVIRPRRPTGDKLTRFGPASARADTGMIHVVIGAWNRELHDELEAVPEQTSDDQMDALSDCVAILTGADDGYSSRAGHSRAGRR